MFLQILYAVVKGLLEMDGYQVRPVSAEPVKPESACCPPEQPEP